MSFNYSINQQDNSAVVSLSGRLLTDGDTQHMSEGIAQLLNDSVTLIVMDLTQLEHCNSSGLGFIIRTLTRARINQAEFVISGVKGSVAKLFEISKIDNIISMYNNQEDALLHFTKNK
jgi:anti-anti-sigma factor